MTYIFKDLHPSGAGVNVQVSPDIGLTIHAHPYIDALQDAGDTTNFNSVLHLNLSDNLCITVTITPIGIKTEETMPVTAPVSMPVTPPATPPAMAPVKPEGKAPMSVTPPTTAPATAPVVSPVMLEAIYDAMEEESLWDSDFEHDADPKDEDWVNE